MVTSKILKTKKQSILNLNTFFNNNNKKTLKIVNNITKNTKQNINQHNNELINKILNMSYGLDNTININLIKYSDVESKVLNKEGLDNFKLCKSYGYEILNEYFDKITVSYKLKEELLKSLKIDSAPIVVKSAMEDFTRGMSNYINTIYKNLPIKISNAFCKLWEVLDVFDDIIPTVQKISPPPIKIQNKFKVFHICEAPGNMIVSTKYFVEKHRKNIKKANYDWRANTLNPNNSVNQGVYNKGAIFGDTYNLIKNNPQKWLWGEDNTGDITKVDNIKWYRKYIHNEWLQKGKHDKLDFICGDGGLSTDTNNPLLLQKLDLAQVITVLACSSIGGSCCIKHFTPYIKRYTDTYEASGFFIGFLYLYYLSFDSVNLFKPYTSNPDSGEFYVVGRGFKGIDEKQLENLYTILDNFKLNDAIINKEHIPETFLIQINNFLEKMSNLNSINIEKQNLLLTCYKQKHKIKSKNNTLQCNNFLNKNKLKDILIPRYKTWIKIYKFE